MTSLLVLVCLGVLGGAVTTVAGMGGGIFLLLVLSLFTGPAVALAITSPALLVSNMHRTWIFRGDVDPKIVRLFAIGSVPATIVTGAVAAKLPPLAVQIAMLSMTTYAVLRALDVVRFVPKPRAFVPMSAVVGMIGAGAGAAGMIAGPLLMSVGLSGSRYVATAAACSVVVHSARIIGYQAGGLLTTAHLASSIALFAGLAAGNLAGQKFRGVLTPRAETRIELGALVVCTALAMAGVGIR